MQTVGGNPNHGACLTLFPGLSPFSVTVPRLPNFRVLAKKQDTNGLIDWTVCFNWPKRRYFLLTPGVSKIRRCSSSRVNALYRMLPGSESTHVRMTFFYLHVITQFTQIKNGRSTSQKETDLFVSQLVLIFSISKQKLRESPIQSQAGLYVKLG